MAGRSGPAAADGHGELQVKPAFLGAGPGVAVVLPRRGRKNFAGIARRRRAASSPGAGMEEGEGERAVNGALSGRPLRVRPAILLARFPGPLRANTADD